ncbi:MAG: thymidylate synthase [Epsilonproteobacteria bacterium]|nr:thymidylate synthase [Campylobacterota bacterium]
MKAYLDIVRHVLDNGVRKENRTGVEALTVAGQMFEHAMVDGFPLLTTKKVPFRLVATELEFFIKGITDKKWLQDRNNHIWDEWAYPRKAPYGHSEQEKQRMFDEQDLGPIYGFQWRHFGAEYSSYDADYTGKGHDQFKQLVDTLKSNPHDRRMLVCAWNPPFLKEMALPPCHYAFQVTVIDGALNLLWNQRSVDVMLGLPFNIASYALLLHLLAKEAGLKEGKLIGFLADVHIYTNHVQGALEQVKRDPSTYELPSLMTEPFTSIFNWSAQDSIPLNYQSHPRIKFEIAV